jgi:hypothetical protein
MLDTLGHVTHSEHRSGSSHHQAVSLLLIRTYLTAGSCTDTPSE